MNEERMIVTWIRLFCAKMKACAAYPLVLTRGGECRTDNCLDGEDFATQNGFLDFDLCGNSNQVCCVPTCALFRGSCRPEGFGCFFGEEAALTWDASAIDMSLCPTEEFKSVCCLPDETLQETLPETCELWLLQESRRDQSWIDVVNDALPCPCMASEAEANPQLNEILWGIFDDLEKNHPGATICYRGTVSSGNSKYGQQCCYSGPTDECSDGIPCHLIVRPPGAGSLDKGATGLSLNDYSLHKRLDVDTYDLCGPGRVLDYYRFRPAFRGTCSDCLSNKSDETASWKRAIEIDFVDAFIRSTNTNNLPDVTFHPVRPVETNIGGQTVYTGLMLDLSLPVSLKLNFADDVLTCKCVSTWPREILLPTFFVRVKIPLRPNVCFLLSVIATFSSGGVMSGTALTCAIAYYATRIAAFLLSSSSAKFRDCVLSAVNGELIDAAEELCLNGQLHGNTEATLWTKMQSCGETVLEIEQEDLICEDPLPLCNQADLLEDTNCCIPSRVEKKVALHMAVDIAAFDGKMLDGVFVDVQALTGASRGQLSAENVRPGSTILVLGLSTSTDISRPTPLEILDDLQQLKEGDPIGGTTLLQSPEEDFPRKKWKRMMARKKKKMMMARKKKMMRKRTNITNMRKK